MEGQNNYNSSFVSQCIYLDLYFLGLVYAYLSYIRKEKYCPATTTPAAALYVTLRVPPLDSLAGWTG